VTRGFDVLIIGDGHAGAQAEIFLRHQLTGFVADEPEPGGIDGLVNSRTFSPISLQGWQASTHGVNTNRMTNLSKEPACPPFNLKLLNVIGSSTASASLGERLLDVLRRREGLLPLTCGGVMSCGACHVRIEPPLTLPMAPRERELLETADVPFGKGSRLACQVKVTPDLVRRTIEVAAHG